MKKDGPARNPIHPFSAAFEKKVSGIRSELPAPAEEPGKGPDMDFVRSVLSRMTDAAQLRSYAEEFPFAEGRLEAVRRLHELGEHTLLKYMLIASGRPEVKEEIRRLIAAGPHRE
ncbi:MAG: hypothetical protein AB1324_08255 [Candidatus Micrarchaeota archaeon]